jgi:hypothetical protein
VRRKRSRSRRLIYPESGEGGLELTAIGDVRITGRLGEGVTCVVCRGEWKGREVTVKLYKASAVEWHARRHRQELAEFEYRRNKAFHEVPGLARYVARPLAYLATGPVSALVQERLDGLLYHRYYRERNGEVPGSLREHLRRIVELAHEAGLYDVDLHARNVMVVTENGEPIPKLFDFNYIPFYERPRNPFVALLLKIGLLGRRSRDLRKLRRFHDFSRLENNPVHSDYP